MERPLRQVGRDERVLGEFVMGDCLSAMSWVSFLWFLIVVSLFVWGAIKHNRKKKNASRDLLGLLLPKKGCPYCRSAGLVMEFTHVPLVDLDVYYGVCRRCDGYFRVYLWEEGVLEEQLDRVLFVESRKFNRRVMSEIEDS